MIGQESRRRRAGKPPRGPAMAPDKPAKRLRRARGEGWIWGRHAVAAVLANPRRRWHRIAVLAGEEREAARLVATARAERQGGGDALAMLDRAALNLMLPEGAVHQGWAVETEPLDPPDLDEALAAAEPESGRAVVVVLDQVTDPHNVGAVLRSAAAFGAVAVIVAEHAAPPVTGILAKAASGALEQVPLVRAINLARALDRLKDKGYWCCGLDEAAPETLAALDLGARVALVLGSEGGGLRRLVREHCDYLARLPTRPELPSLNVSNAAAVALYELARNASTG